MDGWMDLREENNDCRARFFSHSIERESMLKGFVLVDTLVESWRWWVFGSPMRWIS